MVRSDMREGFTHLEATFYERFTLLYVGNVSNVWRSTSKLSVLTYARVSGELEVAVGPPPVA